MHSSCYPQEDDNDFADKSDSSQSILTREHNMKRTQFKKAIRPNSVTTGIMNPSMIIPPITTPKRQEINPDVILFDSNEKEKDEDDRRVGQSVENLQKAAAADGARRGVVGMSNQKVGVKATAPIKSFNEIISAEVKAQVEDLRREIRESYKLIALESDTKKGKINQLA
jgi:hypothetical protein